MARKINGKLMFLTGSSKEALLLRRELGVGRSQL